MHLYYVVIECASCDEEIYTKCATTIEHNGLPVIPYDIAEGQKFLCPRCDEVTVANGELIPYDVREL
jgi:predicted RNA-binding Zn-ribbon protein involved in translation (DUF1610 family)